MPINNSELLKHWVATGYSSQAVAGYGNSVEFLQEALISGEIPWSTSHSDQDILPYRKKLLSETSGYLYFAYPFIDRLKSYNPHIVEKLCSEPGVNLEENTIKNNLRDYAVYNAITHYFKSQADTNIQNPKAIVTLVHLLFPDLVKKFNNDSLIIQIFNRFTESADWEEPHSLGLEESNMTIAQLKNILGQSISRRGIIMYYNEKILRNRVVPGIESEEEIMIISKRPLTLEVISGIEILSENDKRAIENLIDKPI